jgi:predicted  nucleic acid-binding Zn-ribbon protein
MVIATVSISIILYLDKNSLSFQIGSLQSNIDAIRDDENYLKSQIEILQTDFEILKTKKNSFESLVNTLEFNLTSIEFEKSSLESQMSQLKTNLTTIETQKELFESKSNNLEDQKSLLMNKIGDLEFQINFLQKSKLSLESHLSMLQSNMDTRARITNLSSQITSLQITIDDYFENYQFLRSLINGRAVHPNPSSFITPFDSKIIPIVNEITGGWSNTSDFDEFWKDIKEINMWILNNIEYRTDGLYPILPFEPGKNLRFLEDMWQFPNETINLRKGDCEDQAVLLCSMIGFYNKGLGGVHCVWLSSSYTSHLGIQISKGENTCTILDPAGNYCSENINGSIVYSDVSSEINNWLDYWKPTMGSDVYVSCIFYEGYDVRFASTSEYIKWMEQHY